VPLTGPTTYGGAPWRPPPGRWLVEKKRRLVEKMEILVGVLLQLLARQPNNGFASQA